MASAEKDAGAPLRGVVGVVLAGGASRRMGRDKAALLIGGETLLRRAVERLRLALAEVIVVGAPSLAPLVPDTRIVADGWPGRGPLGALATALGATDAPWVLLVACDMPFTQPALIREIARRALASKDVDVVALRGARGVEPLHAAYSRACLPLALERLAGDDASLRGLLAVAPVAEVSPAEARALDPESHSAFNANTPEEWRAALRLAEAERDQHSTPLIPYTWRTEFNGRGEVLPRKGVHMPEQEFEVALQAEAANLTRLVAAEDGAWVVRGFIDIYKHIYTLSADTKVISKVIELLVIPALYAFGARMGYRLELAPEQNFYPDLTFISLATGDRYAVDIKTTYRTGVNREGKQTVNGMTLGAFTGYFRDRASTKNTVYPYASYKAHLALGVVYSKASDPVDESKVYQLVAETAEGGESTGRRTPDESDSLQGVPVHSVSDLRQISPVATNFLFFVQPKYRIAHWRPGSGNTRNIGSVTVLDQLVNGAGPFAALGETIYDDYWMFYLTRDMLREPGSKRPYADLKSYHEYKRLGSEITPEYLNGIAQADANAEPVVLDADDEAPSEGDE